MKVYIVFVQNKVYQEVGNVYDTLEEAEKEAAEFQSNLGLSSFGYAGAVIIEREIKFKNINQST